jgi:hypothetical protein
VHADFTHFDADGATAVAFGPLSAALPVDLAASSDGALLAIAAPGNWGRIAGPPEPQILLMSVPALPDQVQPPTDPCAFTAITPVRTDHGAGAIVAVAFEKNGTLVFQTLEPPAIGLVRKGIVTDTIALPGETRPDTGHSLFHLGTRAGLACASCHPEGGEDGRVWHFAGAGPRRTQSLRFGLLGTEPFHWSGDMKDFPELVHDVMEKRMSGPSLQGRYIDALANWIDQLLP